MLTFLCYAKCTTCQKAKQWLDDHGVEYDMRDIKEDPPTKEELERWWKMSGLEIRRFFNTSGRLYQSMGLKTKLPDLSEEEQLQLLSTDGMLVKRPLLIGPDFVRVGFKEPEWRAVL